MTNHIIDSYLENNLDESISELTALCAIPSIVAQNRGIDECSALVEKMLKKRGFQTEIMPTGGAPVVYAERKGKTDKTLIFYNHYDVQPAEPIELWDSPPFETSIRDGKIFARGVSDDKGHLLSRLFAIDAILAAEGELPCNVKFIIEGEEEIGSVNLPKFIENNKEKLAGDACIWEFGGVNHADAPIQILGLRGLCFIELEIESLNADVHSGVGGTIFPHAAWRLIWALNTIKGEDEHINLPGYYDDVIPPTERDIALIAKLPPVIEEYKTQYGVKTFLKNTTDEVQLKVQEAFEPSCTICGFTTGYQGKGSKTVLPARASAKLDFRLVPNQSPEKTFKKLRTHLDSHGFQDIKATLLGGESPGRTDPDDPFVKIVIDAAAGIYKDKMVIKPMVGVSGPNHAFLKHLQLPIASAGVGYPGSKTHSPNENMRIDLYLKGAKHITRILKSFGKI